MSKKVGDIEVFTGPQEVGGPDSLKDAIINFIDGAEKRLYIAVQELDCMDIAEAIIRARQKKLLVKLVIEGDYLKVKRALKKPFESKGLNEENRQIHDAILRSNINVKSDYNPKIFHQKFIIRDSSAILSGSTNFTDTGVSTNLNHVIIIHNKDVAKIYNKEFREIQQGHFGKLNEGHDPVPDLVDASNVPIKILFAPDHNPEMEIMKQMLRAKNRIDFAMFTFAKSSGIDDTMIALKKSGIKIRGVMDHLQANQDWAVTHDLNKAGIELYTTPKKGKLRKLHHKLMVIDDQVVIAGSFNYTGPANNLKDENIIIIGSLKTKDNASIEKQKQIGSYMLSEIDRIIQDYGKPV